MNERIRPNLERIISQTKKTAVNYEKLERLDQIDNQATCRFLSGNISLAHYRYVTSIIDNPGSFKCISFDEFLESLFCLGLGDFIYENVRHETAHYRKAVALGLQASYGIRFAKSGRVARFRNCFITIEFPMEMEDSQARNSLKAIISAPSELSMSDREMLGLR